ncbi:MAG TPA: hypothetical protein VM243_08610 [Phycisphaerae bacterium]|nr:hypothetical protein [Phycisphaerae bacterium]
MRIEDVPERYRSLYRRAMTGRSRKAAIRAHCLMCCGWQSVEVEKCTARMCPLYPYRLSSTPTEATVTKSRQVPIMRPSSAQQAISDAEGGPGQPETSMEPETPSEATLACEQDAAGGGAVLCVCNAGRQEPAG